MPQKNRHKSSDSGDDDVFDKQQSSVGLARSEFANGVGKMLNKTPVASDETATVASLAEVGGLPPSENDQPYDVEVLSEAPEIDTTRDDRDDYAHACRSTRKRLFLRHALVSIFVISLFAVCLALIETLGENKCLLNEILNLLNATPFTVSNGGCDLDAVVASVASVDEVEFVDEVASADASADAE